MEGDLQRTFGRNLKAWRQARDISQEALAEMYGKHRTYIGGIERGERNLSLQVVERLADRIDADPLQMLTPRHDGPGSAPAK